MRKRSKADAALRQALERNYFSLTCAANQKVFPLIFEEHSSILFLVKLVYPNAELSDICNATFEYSVHKYSVRFDLLIELTEGRGIDVEIQMRMDRFDARRALRYLCAGLSLQTEDAPESTPKKAMYRFQEFTEVILSRQDPFDQGKFCYHVDFTDLFWGNDRPTFSYRIYCCKNATGDTYDEDLVRTLFEPVQSKNLNESRFKHIHLKLYALIYNQDIRKEDFMVDYEKFFEPIGEIYRQEGMAKGGQDMQIKIAKELSKRGMPLEEVSACVGLEPSALKKLLADE